MNLKLFSLAICFWSFNVAWAMDEKHTKGVESKASNGPQLKYSYISDVIVTDKQLFDSFDKAFTEKKYKKCVETLQQLYMIIPKQELNEVWQKYKKKDPAFCKFIINESSDVHFELSANVKHDLNKRLGEVVLFGKLSEFNQLLYHGADKDYIDVEGFAVVHLAAFFGQFQKVKVLAKHKADFTVKTRDEGWNVLHLVHDSYEMRIIGLSHAANIAGIVLTKHKQLMTEPDKQGRKPVDLFLANDIGKILQFNGIIDENGAVLI